MTYNHINYTLIDCFRYEDITRQYMLNEGYEMDVMDLITAAMEDDRNFGYVNYLIFKRLHYLKYLINLSMNDYGLAFDPNNIKDPKYYLELYEEYYDGCSQYYINCLSKIKGNLALDIEDVVKFIGDNKQWNLLIYMFLREEKDLRDFVDEKVERLVERKNSLKDRKFFILQ